MSRNDTISFEALKFYCKAVILLFCMSNLFITFKSMKINYNDHEFMLPVYSNKKNNERPSTQKVAILAVSHRNATEIYNQKAKRSGYKQCIF